MNQIWRTVRRIYGVEPSGLACRSCGEGIARHDHFGLSEQVCRACRSDYNR